MDVRDLARLVIEACAAKGLSIATAESCTGGLVAAALTEIPGASAVVERGFVTYSNTAKTAMLGVPAPLIGSHGAVSAEVARSMAEGALAASGASLSVAVTGIAGPGGGSRDKPVGLVHLACARTGAATLLRERRYGDLGRVAVRAAATRTALELLFEAIPQEE